MKNENDTANTSDDWSSTVEKKMSYCHWRGRSSYNKMVLVVSAPSRCRSAILRNFLIGWNMSIRFMNIGSFASSRTDTQRRINVSLNVFSWRSFEFSCVKSQILRSNYTVTHQQVNFIVQAVSRADLWNDSISNVPRVPIKIFTLQTWTWTGKSTVHYCCWLYNW